MPINACVDDVVDRAKESLRHLYDQENRYVRNPLSTATPSLGRHRTALIRWFIALKNSFDFNSNFVHLSTSIFDRVIHLKPNARDGDSITRIAWTSIYIASKMEGKCFSQDDIVSLSRNKITRSNLNECEREIFDTLEFKLNPPTLPYYFQGYFDVIEADANCIDLMNNALEPKVERILKENFFPGCAQPELSFALFSTAADEINYHDGITEVKMNKLKKIVREVFEFNAASDLRVDEYKYMIHEL